MSTMTEDIYYGFTEFQDIEGGSKKKYLEKRLEETEFLLEDEVGVAFLSKQEVRDYEHLVRTIKNEISNI